MKNWETFHKVLGLLFVVIGVVLYITPIPGMTLLIILGLVWLVGKKKTSYFLKEVLGKKIFGFFRIKRVVERM